MLARIETFLRQSGMPQTKFGREVVRDPRLVGDMRRGRELREPTAARVAAYLDRAEAALPSQP